MGEKEKTLLFPFKQRKGYIPPEFISKLPSDQDCADTVKISKSERNMS